MIQSDQFFPPPGTLKKGSCCETQELHVGFIQTRKIESQLFETMESARRRYRTGAAGRDEYTKALAAFNDFVIYGKLPDGMSPLGETGSS